MLISTSLNAIWQGLIFLSLRQSTCKWSQSDLLAGTVRVLVLFRLISNCRWLNVQRAYSCSVLLKLGRFYCTVSTNKKYFLETFNSEVYLNNGSRLIWLLVLCTQILYKENLSKGTPLPVTPEMERVRRNQENFSSVFGEKISLITI